MASFWVSDSLDVLDAQRQVTHLGRQLGFAPADCAELAVVVSELATNILKYGVRGCIQLQAIRDGTRGVGLEVVAVDEGPPFWDFDQALCDGCDDRGPVDPAHLNQRGGLASGLGAVRRFTHELRLEAQSSGKRIVARRYRTDFARA